MKLTISESMCPPLKESKKKLWFTGIPSLKNMQIVLTSEWFSQLEFSQLEFTQL